jgi:hypothetical protein
MTPPLLRPLAVATLLASAGLPARAGDIAAITSATGVAVEASVEGGNRLVISVVPGAETRLNGHLGVGLSAGDGSAIWSDPLPRTTLADRDYFAGAVLETVHFDPRSLTAPATLGISYGACLATTDICVYEEAVVTLTPGGNGPDVTLSALQP